MGDGAAATALGKMMSGGGGGKANAKVTRCKMKRVETSVERFGFRA